MNKCENTHGYVKNTFSMSTQRWLASQDSSSRRELQQCFGTTLHLDSPLTPPVLWHFDFACATSGANDWSKNSAMFASYRQRARYVRLNGKFDATTTAQWQSIPAIFPSLKLANLCSFLSFQEFSTFSTQNSTGIWKKTAAISSDKTRKELLFQQFWHRNPQAVTP